MLGLPVGAKIYFCTQPVDFRKSFDGLGGIVESVFEMNVTDGHLFLFVNRRRELILWYKRLEQGTIELPVAEGDRAHVTIDATQLAMLIGGVPLASSRTRRKRLHAA